MKGPKIMTTNDTNTTEVDELHALVARQHAILTGVANALRGDPGPLASHGHHDLAERAALAVAEIEQMRRGLADAFEIISGRTTAPTDAEIAALTAVGGLFFWRSGDVHASGNVVSPCTRTLATEKAIRHGATYMRWWALDNDGRPCPWPMVTQ